MKTISSRQNAWFKRARSAIREHAEEIVIEGPKPVEDAVAAGWRPVLVITRDQEVSRLHGFAASGIATAQPRNYETVVFSRELFDSIADTKMTQGVLGIFERPRFTLEAVLARRDTVVIALDGVQDPGNVGTIVRLAAAFDAAGVVLLPGCADPYGPKAIRATAGAILGVPVASATQRHLIDSHFPLFVTDAAGETIAPPASSAILVFGSEGSGVSPGIRSVSKRIAIATSGRVESLNVAASVAILLARSFERRRAARVVEL